MTTITIDREVLEQAAALLNPDRSPSALFHQRRDCAEAIRAAISAPATAPDEIERLRAESEERLQNCAALVAEVERLRAEVTRPESTDMTLMRALVQSQATELERLRKDAERKPITDEDTLALFNRIQTGMRFTDAAARPFAAGVTAAEFFHKIKGTP